MNKRIVWNFEVNNECPLNLLTLKAQEKEPLRWERRFFWPEETIITLNALDANFLAFTHCKMKQRADQYYLVDNTNYNIKKRNDSILYKPCRDKKNSCLGFEKKINLSTSDLATILPGSMNPAVTVRDLLAKIHQKKQGIFIEKTAFVYKLPTNPTIKLELARLQMQDKIYYTACIEGYSLTAVSFIAEQLLKPHVSCDYVTFLQQNQK